MNDMDNEMIMDTPVWHYCAVGNIKKSHMDEEGILRYGTKAFKGGTKVYICGRFWEPSREKIEVIGMNRFKKYALEYIPVNAIENVRLGKAYQKNAVSIMEDWEFEDLWWGHYKRDKKDVERFVALWEKSMLASDIGSEPAQKDEDG